MGPSESTTARTSVAQGLAPSASTGVPRLQGDVTLVLCYHRVLPRVADDPYHLALTTDRFEEQLDALGGWARFIGPEQLVDPRAAEDDGRPRVLVTFDDGYRDNLEHAFPRLAQRGIPAVLFAATGAIDRSAPFWWEQVALAHERDATVRLDDPDGWRFLPAGLRARRVAPLTSSLSSTDRERVANLAADWPTLVAETRRFGITLAAHTRSHSSLGRLGQPELDREIAESLSAIATWTGQAPSLFAYPHGSPDDVSIAAIDALRRHGVSFAFTTEAVAMRGAPLPGSRAALTAPRIVVGDEGAHDLLARLSSIVDAAKRCDEARGATRRSRPRVAVLSGISAHNIGDDAMLLATVHDLRAIRPDVDLCVLAETPDACRALESEAGVPILKSPHDLVQRVIAQRAPGVDPVDAVTEAAHRVCVAHEGPFSGALGVPLADDELEGLAWLLDADGVIDCGGANLDGHWMDYLYEKCFDYLVAARPLVVTGQGVGHLSRSHDRELLGRALERVDCLTVREDVSVQHVRETGFGGRVTVSGDDALSLEPAAPGEIDRLLASVGVRAGEAFVAFQFRRTLDYDSDDALHAFATVIDEVADVTGLPVVGIPMHFRGCDEREHLAALASRTRRPDALRIIPAELGARQALGLFARATVTCGISYHSAVFSLRSGTPFVGIYKGAHYTQKFEGLSRLYAIPHLALPLDGLAAADVGRALRSRLEGASALRTHLAMRHDELLEAVRRPRRALLESVTRKHETTRRLAVPPVEWGSLRRIEPVSADWGFDRGQPLDRYYIDHFIAAHRGDIRGIVCELLNREYTDQFGEGRVTKSEVLDIDSSNATATIIGDLTRPGTVPRDTFDCFILTQTLSYIHECGSALANAYAATAPGGTLLVTVPSIIRYHREPEDHWRFTVDSLTRLARERCPGAEATVTAHGNVLGAVAFLYGLASSELTPFELEHHDPRFPLVITARIRKGRVA